MILWRVASCVGWGARLGTKLGGGWRAHPTDRQLNRSPPAPIQAGCRIPSRDSAARARRGKQIAGPSMTTCERKGGRWLQGFLAPPRCLCSRSLQVRSQQSPPSLGAGRGDEEQRARGRSTCCGCCWGGRVSRVSRENMEEKGARRIIPRPPFARSQISGDERRGVQACLSSSLRPFPIPHRAPAPSPGPAQLPKWLAVDGAAGLGFAACGAIGRSRSQSRSIPSSMHHSRFLPSLGEMM